MDYTRTPGENKSPGPENFLFLQQMYGTVNDRRSFLRRLITSNSPRTETVHHMRERRVSEEKMAHVMQRAIQQIEQRSDGQEHLDGWTEEHRSELGSLHSRHFGDGYTVKVAKLLVTEDEM